MAYVEVAYEQEKALLYLNRPERLNAVVPALLHELCVALTDAAERAAAVVVGGRGRAFCSGHDLKEPRVYPDAASHGRDISLAQDVTRLMRSFPGPTLVTVQGYALGVGAEIALAADFVIATGDAMFGFPEIRRGLSVTGGISHLLPQLIGLARAREMILLGEWISGERAAEIGMIHSTATAPELELAAAALADRLLDQPRAAFERAKRTLHAGAEGSLEHALAYEVAEALASRATYPGGEE